MTNVTKLTEMKRALSLHEVRECEFALKPVCKCRCRGAYHGAARLEAEAGTDQFRALPSDDPHHLLTRQESKAAATHRRMIRNYHRSRYGSGHSAPANLEFIQMVRTYTWNWETKTNEIIEFPCPLCIEDGRDPKMEDREAEA